MIRYVKVFFILLTAALLVQPSSKKNYQDTRRISKNFLLGKFDYTKDTSFVKVDAMHTAKTIYLKKEVYQAFLKMNQKAKMDGIRFTIISGTRNFYEQKWIWEKKWKRYTELKPKERALKILEFSSMPSSSRHHWGTDIDLNSLFNVYFETGKGKKEYQWLQKNAHRFGFYQVYSDKKNGRTGYEMERWHWSYLPLSSQYLNAYNKLITEKNIQGFEGHYLADSIEIIKKYVNGIDAKLRNHQ